VPDLLKRAFTAEAPNLIYVGDITYLPLANGNNLYLATVIDCYSRRLAGWAVADHMRTELVTDALNAAQATRGNLAGAVFHSDHGSVYTSKDCARLCSQLGVTQSMGAVGTSADNSLAESFNATLKREVLQDHNTWPDEPPAAARSSGGWSATTPAAGTPGAATNPRTPTRPATPLPSRQRHKSTTVSKNQG
jgi:transposase InsO family protein